MMAIPIKSPFFVPVFYPGVPLTSLNLYSTLLGTPLRRRPQFTSGHLSICRVLLIWSYRNYCPIADSGFFHRSLRSGHFVVSPSSLTVSHVHSIPYRNRCPMAHSGSPHRSGHSVFRSLAVVLDFTLYNPQRRFLYMYTLVVAHLGLSGASRWLLV